MYINFKLITKGDSEFSEKYRTKIKSVMSQEIGKFVITEIPNELVVNKEKEIFLYGFSDSNDADFFVKAIKKATNLDVNVVPSRSIIHIEYMEKPNFFFAVYGKEIDSDVALLNDFVAGLDIRFGIEKHYFDNTAMLPGDFSFSPHVRIEICKDPSIKTKSCMDTGVDTKITNAFRDYARDHGSLEINLGAFFFKEVGFVPVKEKESQEETLELEKAAC